MSKETYQLPINFDHLSGIVTPEYVVNHASDLIIGQSLYGELAKESITRQEIWTSKIAFEIVSVALISEADLKPLLIADIVISDNVTGEVAANVIRNSDNPELSIRGYVKNGQLQIVTFDLINNIY